MICIHRPSKGVLSPLALSGRAMFSVDKTSLSCIVCRSLLGQRGPYRMERAVSLGEHVRFPVFCLQISCKSRLGLSHRGDRNPHQSVLPVHLVCLLRTGQDLPVLLNKRRACVSKTLLCEVSAKVFLPYLLIKGKPHFPLPGPCSHTANGYLIAPCRLGYTDARDNAICCDD